MSARARSLSMAGALGVVGLAVLTACGGSASGSTAAAAAPSAAPSGAASGGATGGATGGRTGGPAASGLIAAADGSTLQVQSRQDGQVAVTWSASTTFTQQVSVAASSIKAGDCVTAASTTGDGSSTSFTATTVRVTAAVDGQCDGGFGGGGGGFPGGGGTRPTGAPSGGAMPSGAPSGGGVPSDASTRTGTFATGSVVSVSGSTLVVAARQFDRGASGTPSAGSTPTTVNDTVTLTSTTKITTEQKATSAAATVGRCATAQGKADSTGAVAATSIAVTDAVDGACTGGFGGFGGPGRGGAGSGTTNG